MKDQVFTMTVHLIQKQSATVAPIGQGFTLGTRNYRTFDDLKTAVTTAFGWTPPATHELMIRIDFQCPADIPEGHGSKMEHVTLSARNWSDSMDLLEEYVTSFEVPALTTILGENIKPPEENNGNG